MKRNIPLWKCKDWWKSQKLEGDKGGSFNVDLYFQVCHAKQNQDGKIIS